MKGRAVGKDIRTVEYGWPIGMPVCKDLKNGLLEVRTQLSDRICRILFSIHGSRMVLRKAPRRELDTALDRKRHLENRK